MNHDVLNRCPQCSGKAEKKKYFPHHTSRIIFCISCDYELWVFSEESEEDLIKLWNNAEAK